MMITLLYVIYLYLMKALFQCHIKKFTVNLVLLEQKKNLVYLCLWYPAMKISRCPKILSGELITHIIRMLRNILSFKKVLKYLVYHHIY